MSGAPAQAVVHGLVSNVQRFSLHDGPGIRTTVFLKGCPLRCAWCQNPESLRGGIEISFAPERCHDDGRCRAVCRSGALRAGSNRFDASRCDACGRCVDECPWGAYERVGREVTAEALLTEVRRDQPFFHASGGGVTLSGGEPTQQMAFVAAFSARCVDAGVPVVLQTCGAFRWASLAPHLPLFERIHFDLKAVDDALHRRLTGASNGAILGNARRLVDAGAPVAFRTPIVPGHTDGEHDLEALADFLQDLGVGSVQLLRYHAMGEAKLPRLGFPIAPLGLAAEARGGAPVERAADALRRLGIEVTT